MRFPYQFPLDNNTMLLVGITLVILLAGFVVTRLLQRMVGRFIDEPARQYKVSKLIGRVAALVVLVALAFTWSARLGDFVTVLTVFGAGLAIALSEVLLSMAGWVNLTVRAPYGIGDRVEMNGVQGDVIDIRLLHTTLMEIGQWVESDQSTGRLVHLPNAWVYQHGVYNYTRGFGFIWNEIPFTLTFRSDWKAAREIVLSKAQETSQIVEQQVKQQIRRMSREYLVHYSILTPFVYVRVTESGVRLTLRYLCEVRKRRGTEHALTLGILEAFQEHGGIEFAYPTLGLARLDTPQFGPVPGAPPRPGQDPAG